MEHRKQTNIRLSLLSRQQLKALTERLGMTEVQVVTLALDRLARDHGVDRLPAQDSYGPIEEGGSHDERLN